ncbi:hypothetical protein D3C87_2137350 [compost metagenome]
MHHHRFARIGTCKYENVRGVRAHYLQLARFGEACSGCLEGTGSSHLVPDTDINFPG